MSLWTQYLTVFAMSASGAVLGAVYDMYRTILTEWKYLRWMGSILDFVYWIFALGLVLWALQWANDGDIRFYVFLLLGIGLGIYRLLFRRIIVGSTVRIVLAITYFMQMLYRLFLLIVFGPLLWLWKLAIILLRGIDRFASVIEHAILWPFSPLLACLAWLGGRLYQWTLQPLIEPVMKPLKRHVVDPIQKFARQMKAKWKGFLGRVANWLVDSDEDDKPKR